MHDELWGQRNHKFCVINLGKEGINISKRIKTNKIPLILT